MGICEKIEELKDCQHKLLLVVGQPGSGKSRLVREYAEEKGIPILDLDKIFANTPSDQLMHEMKNFLTTYHQDVLLLDNKKILYAKDNNIDLLAFLKELSKDITVVATWNGKIEDGQIFHFRQNAPEDLIYPVDKDSFRYILC